MRDLGYRPASREEDRAPRSLSDDAGATHQRYDRTRQVGTIGLSARLRSVVGLTGMAAQLGGLDEQISWATAERTVPYLVWNIPVGYSVIALIDGKEKVYTVTPRLTAPSRGGLSAGRPGWGTMFVCVCSCSEVLGSSAGPS
jgi:hypothetical protein